MVGDFLVGQAFGDERNELLLAAAQAQAPAVAAAGKRRRIALEVAEQDGAKRARANGFAGMHGLHALENFVCGSIAQQVTVDPRAHTLQKFAFVLGHSDKQYTHVGSSGTHFLYGSQVFDETAARGQQQNTRTCCAGACFAEGLASFSEPRRVETCPLERSFISLSDIGVPFPFAASAFVLEALAPTGPKQSQRE